MTRSDLVEELAARFSQLTHRDAEYAVKAILDAMSDALVRGHRIEIRGFGSFSINRRPPRMGATRAPAKACTSLNGAFPTSSPARPCAKHWISVPPNSRNGANCPESPRVVAAVAAGHNDRANRTDP
jgi:nucleoid DNA-binding protein